MIRRSTLSIVDQVAVSASNFLTGVLVARSCPKEVFGLYVLGFSIIILAQNLQFGLISTPYTVHGPRLQGRDLAEFTGSTLVHQVVASALVVFILCIVWLATHTLGFGPRGLASVIITLIPVICCTMLREFLRQIWFARMLMRRALLMDMAAAVLQVGVILALAHLGLLSASGAFWAIGFACLVVGIGALILDHGSYRIVSRRIAADFFLGWSFGKWVVASSLLWTISMSVYPWLLALFHGTASTAVWGACVGVVAIANPVLGGMQNYWGPKSATVYAHLGRDALRTFLTRANFAIFGILLPFWLILVFAGERLVVVMYGSGYAGTGTLITALGLSLVATAVGFTFTRVLFALERAYLDFRLNVVTLLVLLLAGIPMVRAWGPLGAAAGLLISNALAAGIKWRATVRLLERIPFGVPAPSRRESGGDAS